MTLQDGRAEEISLGEDVGAVAVKVNGICLEVGADGKSVRIVSDTLVDVSAACPHVIFSKEPRT